MEKSLKRLGIAIHGISGPLMFFLVLSALCFRLSVLSEGMASELAESELAESELAESELAESELAESELAESELAESAPEAPETAVWELERRFGLRMFEVEGEILRADVYFPRGTGPFPGVLMIHGGGWVSGSRLHMLAHANAVARAGFTVVAIDYRLAPRHPFPAQLDDCRSALAWIRSEHEALKLDPDRIALYGYSAGGHLACLLGFTPKGASDTSLLPVQAIVAGGAPCDFAWLPAGSRALAVVFGATREEEPERYERASPLHQATPEAPPTLLYHGTDDQLVPIATTTRMYRRLQDLGVSSRLVTVESRGHLAAFLDPEAPRRAVAFLRPLLRPPAPCDLDRSDMGEGE